MGNPKVSIIIPLYKTESYLRNCLDSVAAQHYPYWEALLVNDGSPDNCGLIAEEYAARDERFRVIHRENGGISAARNTGMAQAAGKYLMFIDSDDWWPDTSMVGDLVALAEEENWDIIHFNATQLYKRGPVPLEANLNEADSTETLQRKMFLHQLYETVWNKIYRRSLWEGILFPDGAIIEDYYVMPEVFSRAKRIRVWDRVGYIYNRTNENSLTKKNRHARHAGSMRAAAHHVELAAAGVLTADEEMLHCKKTEAVRYAMRVLIRWGGGIDFPEEDIRDARRIVEKYPDFQRNIKYTWLYHWSTEAPVLFHIYGKIQLSLLYAKRYWDYLRYS